MSVFADQMLLRFSQTAFVDDLLTNKLGLLTLFNTSYESATVDVKEIVLTSVLRKQFGSPAFETIRTIGTEERIVPGPERTKLDRAQPRLGRLAWVDVMLEILVSLKVHSKAMPIESITVKSLVEKLDGVSSLAELRTKLKTLYPDSVVDAFFKKMRINSVDDFKRRGNLFLEFIYKNPPPFDPADPKNARIFRLNVCMQFQPDLKITEAIQAAKLCRSIMENEHNSIESTDGMDVKTPFAFVVIFPDSVIGDNFIPGVTAAQTKTNIKTLFAAENMIAHYFA
jgi:hypothetical protein